MRLREKLERLEALLMQLIERETQKAFYEVEEFARLVGKTAFTVREWCRLCRVKAEKRKSGRGAHAQWVISHEELERYRKEGLLPWPK